MPIDTKHPEYVAMQSSWALARTIMAGERAVKQRGEALVPRLDNATDAQYERFLQRAHFFNATGRTADGYVGLLFRRAPRIRNFERRLEADFDLGGANLLTYARTVVQEVIAVGRCGTFIDWSNADRRAYATLYRAEEILNWRMEASNGRNRLTLLVLSEPQFSVDPADPYAQRAVGQLRVIMLQDGHVTVRIYRQVNDAWILVSEMVPKQRRKPLKTIPFVFHSGGPEAVTVPKLPLEDMITANLDHYRLIASQRNALHFVAMPLLALSGFDLATYGSDVAQNNVAVPTTLRAAGWDAHAKYVEYNGSGLESFEKAIDRAERLMAVLGSRLLEPRKNVGETAEAIELRQSGESSVLASMGLCISESMSEAMRMAQAWGKEPVPGEPLPRITLNADFNTATMTPQMLRELVAAWQAKAINDDEFREAMRRGEVLPPNPTPVVGDPEQ